jgi:DNA end-binding protein Ku
VLRDALGGKGLVAITRVVLRTKQHLAAIMPEGDALLLVLMRFENEIVPVSSVKSELPRPAKASPQELKLAEQLVKTLTAAWDPSQYVDTYTRELKAALEEKAETGTIPAPEAPIEVGAARVMDLLTLLKESVAANGKTKSAPGKPGVKRAGGKKHSKEHAA